MKKVQIDYLKVDKVSIKVSSKYTNFVDVFLPKLVIKLLKYTSNTNYVIELIDDWQSLYGLIYSLSLVKPEILKTYIEKNLVNIFIKPPKSLIKVFILFNQKSNKSLQLYIDY